MLLGTFFVFSFIWGMKAKKRVEYLERRRSIGTKVTVPGDAEKGIARSASYA